LLANAAVGVIAGGARSRLNQRARLAGVDRKTVAVYERAAREWQERRRRPTPPELAAFAARVAPGAVRLDLGCGPGWHSADLGRPTIASDAARAMLELVPAHAPDAWRVQADLESIPFRRGSLGAVWARRSYQHIAAERVPLALADAHRALAVGGLLHVQVPSDRSPDPLPDATFAGRHFSYWPVERLVDVVIGAGFEIDRVDNDGDEWVAIDATRARTLPDFVGPGMRLLLVGLNPSEYAADAGVGFARPGNRFWPAALAAGLVTRSHDPFHALRVDGVGMTDLVKRATPRADALTKEEFRVGAARVERLVSWLQPAAVCFVGLAGYRAAVDRKAGAGWQADSFGGRPSYVMPNPSGLNASSSPADFVAHLRAATQSPG
jgi:TDG/mug DNA glycosylase family protein